MTGPPSLIAVQWLFLGYFVALQVTYIVLDLIALREIRRAGDAGGAAALPQSYSGLEPPVSLLVPAYNEEATIAASIWSLLQLEYPGFEIVVVNDGSRDATLEVLQREFDLRPFPEATRISIPSRPVRGRYRSARFSQLRVIDKENGGKADALNAALNSARCPLVCVVDADSVLQRDSLSRAVRPFLEDATTIACGGTIRIANGCRVSEGFLEKVGMPRSWLARIQVVEYFRAFLFGRLGWSPINAMLVISGAFGVFRREAVVAVGGYRTDTVGEDMDLVVRLHQAHRMAGTPYRIVFVPDPICWTEAPESLRVLRAQRMRWQRGLLESLAASRRLLFHPRGGAVGWVAFPVALLFDAIGPLVEVVGLGLMGVAVLSGTLSVPAFLAFLLAAVGLGLLLSASALLLEAMSFQAYDRPSQLATLLAAMVLENLGYRQLTAWWRLRALLLWLVRRPGRWGHMERSASWQTPRDSTMSGTTAPGREPEARPPASARGADVRRATAALISLAALIAGVLAGPATWGQLLGWRARPLRAEEVRELVSRSGALLLAEKAEEAYPPTRRLVEEFPDNPVYLRRLAELEGRLGRPAAEAALWERFLAVSPTPEEAFPALPIAYRRAGDLSASVAAAERGVALAPHDLDFKLYLGQALEARGDLAQARDVYRTASLLAPGHSDVTVAWARTEVALGDPAMARFVAERGLQLEPDNFDFLPVLATVAELDGRLEEATALLDRYLSRSPNDASVKARRARLARPATTDPGVGPAAPPEARP